MVHVVMTLHHAQCTCTYMYIYCIYKYMYMYMYIHVHVDNCEVAAELCDYVAVLKCS